MDVITVTWRDTLYHIDRETGFVRVGKSLRLYTRPSKRCTVNIGKVTMPPKVTILVEDVIAENVIPERW